MFYGNHDTWSGSLDTFKDEQPSLSCLPWMKKQLTTMLISRLCALI